MRNLWISRSNKPKIVSLSQLFLSLATGVILILHYQYLKPLLAQPYNNIQSVMVFILLVAFIRTILLFYLLRGGASNKETSNINQYLTRINLIYPGMVRAGVYLSIIILAVGDRYLSMTIVAAGVLSFIFWLFMCAKDNEVSQRIDKGRHYNRNPLKMGLLFVLTMSAVILQPQQYSFAFQLHFQIFIIFITILLVFSYLYIHRIVLTFTSRDKCYRLLAWQSLFQLLSLLMIWFYFFFMEQQGLSIGDQLSYLFMNWWAVPIVAVFSTLYEMVLWQHVRKIAMSQLIITLATGFIWFNIYQMMISEIDLRLYISVFVMTAVLFVNIGLFSEANFKRIQKAVGRSQKKRKKTLKRDVLEEQD